MSWSNELIMEFLDIYKREPVIWNPKHPSNRNRIVINEAWSRIQSALSEHFSILELKKKKESLMTSFRMHYNKKRKNPNEYQPIWFAYDFMESFLSLKYVTDDDSTRDLGQKSFDNSSTQDASESDHQYSGRNSHSTEKSAKRHLRLPPPKTNRDDKSYTDYLNNINTANKNSDLINVKKQMDEAVTYLKSAAGLNREMNEIDLYVQLLAKKMRKLDEHQLDITMHEIDNIVFRAMMRSNSKTQRSNSTSPVPRKKSPLFINSQSHSAETQQYEYMGENVEVYQEDDPIEMPSTP